MSQEIINVLNYIGEKLGIAVDWTAENIMPQVMAILGRYRILEIVKSCIWLIIALIGVVIIGTLWKKCIRAYSICSQSEENNFWWDYSQYNGCSPDGAFGLIIFTIIGGIPILAVIFSQTSNLLNWILIPELKFLELFKSIMAS